jgi:hypothetical protein
MENVIVMVRKGADGWYAGVVFGEPAWDDDGLVVDVEVGPFADRADAVAAAEQATVEFA